jgi:hypothetical protein
MMMTTDQDEASALSKAALTQTRELGSSSNVVHALLTLPLLWILFLLLVCPPSCLRDVRR